MDKEVRRGRLEAVPSQCPPSHPSQDAVEGWVPKVLSRAHIQVSCGLPRCCNITAILCYALSVFQKDAFTASPHQAA